MAFKCTNWYQTNIKFTFSYVTSWTCNTYRVTSPPIAKIRHNNGDISHDRLLSVRYVSNERLPLKEESLMMGLSTWIILCMFIRMVLVASILVTWQLLVSYPVRCLHRTGRATKAITPRGLVWPNHHIIYIVKYAHDQKLRQVTWTGNEQFAFIVVRL